jgi:DNA polymerase elongation subunit (family B)
MDPKIPTANRYVGWYTSGEIKIRGVEMRRRDTPLFIKRLQGEMLQVFGRAQCVGELERLIPEALSVARSHLDRLRKGEADPRELVIRRHITRDPEEYTTRTVTAEASQALSEAGIVLAPGEMVEYVVVDASGKRKPEKAKALALYALEDGYDIEHYTELALKAVETLLLPFGYDLAKLSVEMGVPSKRRAQRKPQPAQAELPFAV